MIYMTRRPYTQNIIEVIYNCCTYQVLPKTVYSNYN